MRTRSAPGMSRVVAARVTLLLVLSAITPASAEPKSKQPIIDLKASGCAEGQCPQFRIQVFENGVVVYSGGLFARRAGVVR